MERLPSGVHAWRQECCNKLSLEDRKNTSNVINMCSVLYALAQQLTALRPAYTLGLLQTTGFQTY